MRVKEMIKYLENQNPEDIVILRDFGQDTGDITFFYEDDDGILSDGSMESNLRVMSFDEIYKELKYQQRRELNIFLEKYGRTDEFKNKL